MNRHPANISIVIPCFNEADCIMALYAALCQVMQENAVLYELVFVDDGSTDGTLDLLSHLSQITYEAHARYAGKTKYSFRKMFSFALCGITSFSVRPLRWAIALAAFFALLAIAEIIYVIYVACFAGQTVSGWASLAILISVLGAAILLMLGIMGEYLGKLFMQCKQRPEYIIKDKE